MSISSSLYTALSGLSSHGTAMGIVGDNISNINTAGFKSSSPQFEDILGQSLSGVTGSNQTGAGTNVQSININYTQGSFNTTDVTTDVAINGKGFFVVKDPSTTEEFYTRAGHFHFDNEGYYMNQQGDRVQGYLYDNTGTNLIESLADIQINQGSMIPPRVTTTEQMVLNLDSSAPPVAGGFLIANPTGTSNYTTPVTIYDSLGQGHVIQVYFTNVSGLTIGGTTYGARNWQWNAVIANSDISAPAPGVGTNYTVTGHGILQFGANGNLTGVLNYAGAAPATISAEPFHAQADVAVTYANGVTASDSAIDFTGTTQYGTVSAIQSINQNGYSPGTASSIAIDPDGNVTASYTNGQVKKIARLALANFSDINGLQRRGSNLYSETVASGQPLVNKPGDGGMGTISASMLEESNVDLAGEIIKMVVIQRGYEANAKVITTTDALMNTLINIR
jgi:flagellar hook protein FlgE